MLKGARATLLGPLRWLWSALLIAAVTLVAFGLLRTYEKNGAEDHFQKAALERLDRFDASIRLALIDLIHLAAYYDINQAPDRRTFAHHAPPAPLLSAANITPCPPTHLKPWTPMAAPAKV